MMQFVLSGFEQVGEFRVFSFEGIGRDRVRSEFTVRINLALSRRYGIRIQELPLLCRGILERGEAPASRAMTFTEGDMDQWAKESAARAASTQKRPFHRRPSSASAGSAWRTAPGVAVGGSAPPAREGNENDGEGGVA